MSVVFGLVAPEILVHEPLEVGQVCHWKVLPAIIQKPSSVNEVLYAVQPEVSLAIANPGDGVPEQVQALLGVGTPVPLTDILIGVLSALPLIDTFPVKVELDVG